MLETVTRLLLDIPLILVTAITTHLVMSFAQTLMHYKLGHHPMGGKFFRNQINFHHTYYSKDHLVSPTYLGEEGTNAPFIFVPVILAGGLAYFLLPLNLFIVLVIACAPSFFATFFSTINITSRAHGLNAMHGSDGNKNLSGRGADYSTPPPQIPACGYPAPGSRRRSNAIVGLDATDPQARCFSDMLSPALSPEHVLLLTFPSTGRLPSAISAADFSRLCSMLHRYYAAVRFLVCSATASSPRLPVAARDRTSDCGPNEVSQVPTRSFHT